MVKIFSIEDRKSTLDYILSTAKDCPKIVSLVQVGSELKVSMMKSQIWIL